VTKYDKIIEKVKGNKVLVVVILIVIIVISLGDFSESITKIVGLFSGEKTTEISKPKMANNTFDRLIPTTTDKVHESNKKTLSNLLFERDLLKYLGKLIEASNCRENKTIDYFIDIMVTIKLAEMIKIKNLNSDIDKKKGRLETMRKVLNMLLSDMETRKKIQDTPLYIKLHSRMEQLKMETEMELDGLNISYSLK
jgi:hypothetical protein